MLREDAAPAQADWLVVVDPPEEDEERARNAVAGDAAVLLDNTPRPSVYRAAPAGTQGAYVTAGPAALAIVLTVDLCSA